FGLDERVMRLRADQTQGMDWGDVVRQSAACCLEKGLELLVVDGFTRLSGLSGEEENDAGSMNKALEPLLGAAAMELSVVVITHQRKSGGKTVDSVRGSNALTGAVDIVITMPSRRQLNIVSRFDS